MEKMYQDYKDIAEFRLIYIREAHAIDSNRPVGYAREKGITQHRDYDQRCTTAKMLMDDNSLTMPMLIDSMDNHANESYRAYPDRVFLVRKDGRLAVAADRGPWGFNPGLEAVQRWLDKFESTGSEPKLSDKQIEQADRATEERKERARRQLADRFQKLAGTWSVVATSDDGEELKGQIKFAIEDGVVKGTAIAGEAKAPLETLRFDGTTLSFKLEIHEVKMKFTGKWRDLDIRGTLTTDQQDYDAIWTRDQ